MELIKDKQVIDNTWTYLSNDTALKNGDITVSASRWLQDRAELLNHNGKVGVRITPESSIDEIVNDLPHIELIELDFPDFADGRLFSHAWLLRNRYQYQGEIRATGNYMSGQVFYLSRVGVNAFSVEKNEDLPAALTALNDFTVKYQ
ncbi:MAG: DUF934 domain-containing protein [Methylococcaceae bacterium]|nr:DUF934 domain-containing protein [Methylococcaceae bacterium]MDZ4157888.1 DUF934 domain-containing protein [Methylococcales bacterium]MDP2392393.1 DUF934 domain-containing protein [Methylococcaceae bacterium]MDP3021287.1 DUF934 domain-containing protein [Methylococcaceae bacterium]MDP3390871.1 DUF934 domain-containing protein [Methylococcaceae bacterium]